MTHRIPALFAAAALTTAATTHAAVLLAQYTFEDTNGAVADVAPLVAPGDVANNGVIAGGVTFVPVTGAPATAGAGLSGNAILLDGAVGTHVNLTNTSANILNGRTAFSFAAFTNVVTPPSTTGAEDIIFVSHGQAAGGGRGVMQLQTNLGRVRSFARSLSGPAPAAETLGNVDEIAGDNTVPQTGWVHLATTYDIANDNIVIYMNGVEVTTLVESTPTLVGQAFTNTFIDEVNSLYVGLGSNNTGGGENLNAYLDDVRIYDGVLTQAEVAALAVIPEPTSAALALPALALLTRRRR